MRALGSAPWTTAWAVSSSSRADVFVLYLDPKTKVCAAVWGGPHREFGFSLSHLWVSLCCHKTSMLLLILIQINFNTGMKTLMQHFLLKMQMCLMKMNGRRVLLNNLISIVVLWKQKKLWWQMLEAQSSLTPAVASDVLLGFCHRLKAPPVLPAWSWWWAQSTLQ